MRIYICNDSIPAMQEMESVLAELGETNTWRFTNGQELLKAIEDGRMEPDLILMDIDFNSEPAGFTWAKQILKKLPSVPIIMMTAYGELYTQQVLLQFEEAFGYILYPFDKNIVAQYLEKVKLAQEKDKPMIIKIRGHEIKIPESTILYMESENHRVNIYTTKGQYHIYDKLSSLQETCSKTFFACHKSYVVNFDQVKQYFPDHFVLKNNQVIPISRAYRARSKDAFFEYLRTTV